MPVSIKKSRTKNRKSSRKSSRKGSSKRSSRKESRRSSRKGSRKGSKQSPRLSPRKGSRRSSRKGSKKGSRRVSSTRGGTPVYTVYTMHGCGACENAVKLLRDKGEKIVAKEGIKEGGGEVPEVVQEIKKRLEKLGKEYNDYWPKIFVVNTTGLDEYIGGNSDLQKKFSI